MNLKNIKQRFTAQPELALLKLARLIVLVSLLVLLAINIVYVYGHIPELQSEKITTQSPPQVNTSLYDSVTAAAEAKRLAPPLPTASIRDPFVP